LADWTASNEYSVTGRKRALFALKRLSQIRRFLSGQEKTGIFPDIRPDTKDDLGSWIQGPML
jgi:hypothetical protein